ncbi:carbon dioxide-concentrating mechanism protein CcmK [Cyanobacterium aponinum UTEX 3222]|uniref:Carboxysome shell protein CcmK n=3 Tax=Cyanobacterium aponinum TaxID=379064 RepID=K9Z906_CYAAP|nr:carbon dioxide-concentrating mechanism protein CcmK [Cyanobacterium aponinum]WRL42824.1 carbon dioxide-concentrating mechanism protein CcmK [Cyanobacterium aponinum UTEX 3222]AFZ55187.1 microcompartments protein [Cyanobacterium aponinum PCC 10605]MBD2395705.1 carbon dioxide-concentrating mechanism protein CcmK [Cyanobacterium aponinum FACHB-4101]MTF39337.1 BMC domain-containing protein [Cyanobacterium aponinum 0216]PHV63399.1 carbon dioxide-concentrating mechanism protein CcmK [Cyanobacteri
MPEAVGVIETLGFPSILATADAVVKAARVTIVYFDKAEKGDFIIAFRGPVSEVKRAMEEGIREGANVFGGVIQSHYIVPNPPPNVVDVLPIHYTEASEPYRFTF